MRDDKKVYKVQYTFENIFVKINHLTIKKVRKQPAKKFFKNLKNQKTVPSSGHQGSTTGSLGYCTVVRVRCELGFLKI